MVKQLTTIWSLQKLNEIIKQEFPSIEVCKGDTYHYLYSDDDEMRMMLASLPCTSLYVYYVSHWSVEKWKDEIGKLLNPPKTVQQ